MNDTGLTILIGTITLAGSGLSLVLFIYLYQRKLFKKKLENQEILDLLQQQEMKTAYALLEGQDKERKRIASELHDNLGSILTSLNMFSDAIQTKQDPEHVKNIAIKISETASLANQEVRKISHSLDSGLLKHFGLKTAVKQLMEAVEASKKIEVVLEIQVEDKLDNEKGLEIYRIIQELVNNALKHSDCSKLRIDISSIDNEMSIIFQDNGTGFEQDKIIRGMGLNNIEKRVEKLNGDFTIESSIEKGSTFIIELPNI